MEKDKKFLKYVIKAWVDKPKKEKIERTVERMGVLLRLSVNKDDMGKVIGRSGATAKAIRTILRVVGMKHEARVNLKIEEPEGSERRFEKDAPRDRSVDELINDLKGDQK